MSRARPYQRPVLTALLGVVGLVVSSIVIYGVLWGVEFGAQAGPSNPWILFGLPGTADTVAGLGEVTVAVLGIAITVVAIIVELAAARYTPRITELFLRDPINVMVLGFFTVTSTLVLATAMSLYGPTYPSLMVVAATGAMLLSVATVVPYFLYVFHFLTPQSVISRIQRRAEAGLRMAARGDRRVDAGRRELTKSVEQLGDIALNSVVKKDKAIAIAALNALTDVAVASIEARERMPVRWFDAEPLASTDQDFVSFHPSIVAQLSERRTWVEMKVFRQFQGVLAESLHDLQDVAHIVAIHTRKLALLGSGIQNVEATRLSLRLMHTYLRNAINGKDVRTAYNVFNEYRTLAEGLLGGPHEGLVPEMADRARFYGQLAFSRSLAFIQETAAYDLCGLLQAAYDQESSCHDALLEIFLQVDREPDGGEHQEASLRGVRKAQTKLAAFYLYRGNTALAQRIFHDMQDEKPERLLSIRAELEAITEPEFWEVSDRGVDFDWLPASQRAELATFFGWFDGRAGKG
ncbi:MAG: DUF2254 family protein [Myxococcota bacterium]